jgi:hypothetical protein
MGLRQGNCRIVAGEITRTAHDNDLLYARGKRVIYNCLDVGGELRSLNMGVAIDQTK